MNEWMNEWDIGHLHPESIMINLHCFAFTISLIGNLWNWYTCKNQGWPNEKLTFLVFQVNIILLQRFVQCTLNCTKLHTGESPGGHVCKTVFIFIFVYLCICVFVYLCICIFVFVLSTHGNIIYTASQNSSYICHPQAAGACAVLNWKLKMGNFGNSARF